MLEEVEKLEKKTRKNRFGGGEMGAEEEVRWEERLCHVLPVTLLNSSMISVLPLDLGMLPTKRRRFGTLTLIFRCRPPFISISFNCMCT